MEEAKWRKLGRGPLKALNVQELAKEQLATIPPRYIQDDVEKTSHNSSMLLPQIPVIDMEQLLHGHDHDSELERLHFACKEWGFFQVVNHGVSIPLMEKVKSEIQAFFDLPLEEKKKFEQQEGNIEGFGQDIVFSEEQKLDWSDLFYITTLPANMRQPHLFPKLPVSLRDTLEAHSQEFKNLAISILSQIAKGLKMDEKEMRDLYTDGMQILRMNYYPPCPEPDRTYGLNPHSDSDALTILIHLNETEGLQVRKDDTWVPVKPLPNALTVNIGDMMEGTAVMNPGLLLMSVMGLLFPTVLHVTHTELEFGKSELALSRFSSCVMLVAYGSYLYYQLTTQNNLYMPIAEIGIPYSAHFFGMYEVLCTFYQ